MEQDIVGQGVELMLYGMGTVVFFLALLVLATLAMSKAVTRFFPEPLPEPASSAANATPAQDAELVAVISAAVTAHRQRHAPR